jgi:hypothetical protein
MAVSSPCRRSESVGQPFQSRQGRRRIAGRRKPPVKTHTDPLPPWRGGGFAPPGLMKDGMGVPSGGCHPRLISDTPPGCLPTKDGFMLQVFVTCGQQAGRLAAPAPLDVAGATN